MLGISTLHKFISLMWKQIGTKEASSERSISNTSSERKYRRIRPFNQPLSPSLSPTPCPMPDDLSLDHTKQQQIVAQHISSKRDKELLQIFQRSQEQRKANSVLKMNNDVSSQLNTSGNYNIMARSCSVKAMNVESTGTPKCKRESLNNYPLQESMMVEQEEVYEEIHRLKEELYRIKIVNKTLVEQMAQYRSVYHDIRLEVKRELKKYSDLQEAFSSEILKVMKEVTTRYQLQESRTGHFYETPHFSMTTPQYSSNEQKQESIKKILAAIQQIKSRASHRRQHVSQPTSSKTLKFQSKPFSSQQLISQSQPSEPFQFQLNEPKRSLILPLINERKEEEEWVNGQ